MRLFVRSSLKLLISTQFLDPLQVFSISQELRLILADDIIENLQSALESFENLKEQLK